MPFDNLGRNIETQPQSPFRGRFFETPPAPAGEASQRGQNAPVAMRSLEALRR